MHSLSVLAIGQYIPVIKKGLPYIGIPLQKRNEFIEMEQVTNIVTISDSRNNRDTMLIQLNNKGYYFLESVEDGLICFRKYHFIIKIAKEIFKWK